jgi:hypothetical protein
LLLAHAPVDQLIDGALHMRGRNTLSVPIRGCKPKPPKIPPVCGSNPG